MVTARNSSEEERLRVAARDAQIQREQTQAARATQQQQQQQSTSAAATAAGAVPAQAAKPTANVNKSSSSSDSDNPEWTEFHPGDRVFTQQVRMSVDYMDVALVLHRGPPKTAQERTPEMIKDANQDLWQLCGQGKVNTVELRMTKQVFVREVIAYLKAWNHKQDHAYSPNGKTFCYICTKEYDVNNMTTSEDDILIQCNKNCGRIAHAKCAKPNAPVDTTTPDQKIKCTMCKYYGANGDIKALGMDDLDIVRKVEERDERLYGSVLPLIRVFLKEEVHIAEVVKEIVTMAMPQQDLINQRMNRIKAEWQQREASLDPTLFKTKQEDLTTPSCTSGSDTGSVTRGVSPEERERRLELIQDNLNTWHEENDEINSHRARYKLERWRRKAPTRRQLLHMVFPTKEYLDVLKVKVEPTEEQPTYPPRRPTTEARGQGHGTQVPPPTTGGGYGPRVYDYDDQDTPKRANGRRYRSRTPNGQRAPETEHAYPFQGTTRTPYSNERQGEGWNRTHRQRTRFRDQTFDTTGYQTYGQRRDSERQPQETPGGGDRYPPQDNNERTEGQRNGQPSTQPAPTSQTETMVPQPAQRAYREQAWRLQDIQCLVDQFTGIFNTDQVTYREWLEMFETAFAETQVPPNKKELFHSYLMKK